MGYESGLDDYSEDDGMDEWEEEGQCDYGMAEFCMDPTMRDLGLCTTECREYLESVKRDAEDWSKAGERRP